MGLYGIHSHALGIYPLIQSNDECLHSHVAICYLGASTSSSGLVMTILQVTYGTMSMPNIQSFHRTREQLRTLPVDQRTLQRSSDCMKSSGVAHRLGHSRSSWTNGSSRFFKCSTPVSRNGLNR